MSGWTEPVLENKLDLQEVQLTLFVPKWHEQENEYESEQESNVKELSVRQRIIVGLIEENPYISIAQMNKKMKVSKSTIQRDIAKMNGIVKRVGGDKGGHWEIIKQS